MLNLFDKKGRTYRYIYFIDGPWNTLKMEQKFPIFYVDKYDLYTESFLYNIDPWLSKDDIDDIEDGMVIYV
jgi:hypothetical protein